jgi:hypothetical protein
VNAQVAQPKARMMSSEAWRLPLRATPSDDESDAQEAREDGRRESLRIVETIGGAQRAL